MPGRKAMPVDLLLVKGKKNLTKAEIQARKKAENKLKGKNDKLTPPSWLNDIPTADEAKKEFNRIIEEAEELGYITNLDVGQLAIYCRVHSVYVEMSKDNEPDEAALDRLFKQCVRLAGEYGFTPSARAKLAIQKDEDKPKSKEEKMFGDRL